jgi:CRISPR-associated protein Cmr2
MGKWLSGTHEDLPKFAEILHPQVREQLKGQSNWQTVLQTQRLMSPSLHAAISEALANFALKVVPFVVEELHAGRLVGAFASCGCSSCSAQVAGSLFGRSETTWQ